ncbi:hypothetical protein C035_02730 [Brucella melitensis R3/07-2]|nr:hypothetical protein C035_02730 [Brucella melitensis R3/07-2]
MVKAGAGDGDAPDRLLRQSLVGQGCNRGNTIGCKREAQFQRLVAGSAFRDFLANDVHIAGEIQFPSGIFKAGHMQVEAQDAGKRLPSHGFDQLIIRFAGNGF